nr:DMT family transporter [Oceanicola granulosus]
MSDNTRGALLMMAAMTAFTLNDACLKLISGQITPMQAVFLRGLLTTALLAVAALWSGALRVRLARRDLGLVLLRGVAEAAAAWFFLTALFNMPLADMTAILQALPLAVTLGAALVFGESVGWKRVSAILAGFVGVLLIVRPGSDVFSVYSLFGVATVFCATVRDLATRRLSREVPSLTVTLASASTVTVLAALVGLGEEWATPTPGEYGIIALSSVLVLIAYLTVIMAMRVGDIALVAPFRYTGLLVAIVLGLVVFGDWPDALTWTGSAIVVGSGLFAFWRERQLAVPRPRVPPR